MLSWFKDDVFRRLFVNAGRLLTANVIATVVGLVITVLTARALGPANYGVLALVLVYGLTIGKLVTFSAWEAIIKFGSEALDADDHPALRQLIKFGFSLDIASAIVGTVLAMALSGPVISLLGWDQSVRSLLVLYSVLILFSLSGTPVGVLRLFDRFDLLSYTAVLSAVVRLVGVLWCLVTGQGLFGFVLVYLITGIAGQLYQVFASLWVLRKEGIGDLVREPMHGIGSTFPGILDYVWITNVTSTIRMVSREADELIVAGLTTPAALGLFKVAKQFSQVLPRLTDPLYQAIYPELTRLWAADRKKAFISLIKRTTLIAGVMAIVGWVGFLLVGRWLIAVTVGPGYLQAYIVALIYLLAIGIELLAFSMQPSMLAIGLPRNALKALVAATVLYLVLLFSFVHSLGISGASLAYVAFYAVWLALMLWYLWPSLVSKPSHA
jgi:O-antigen/teichoic acid export membrane protein